MDETRIWGGIGVLLSLAGAVIIFLDKDFMDALQTMDTNSLILYYGIGVCIAFLLTAIVMVPNMFSSD